MAIEIYSKSNIGLVEHFGYLHYKDLDVIRKAADELQLACLQFLPYGGDILFNSEQASHILKKEIPLLQTHVALTPEYLEAINAITRAALAVSQKTHTFLIFEGD